MAGGGRTGRDVRCVTGEPGLQPLADGGGGRGALKLCKEADSKIWDFERSSGSLLEGGREKSKARRSGKRLMGDPSEGPRGLGQGQGPRTRRKGRGLGRIQEGLRPWHFHSRSPFSTSL